MTKQDYYERLVELGRLYDPTSPFPFVKYETKDGLRRRVLWMEKAHELKQVDFGLSYQLYFCAWGQYPLESSIAEKAGLA